MTRKLNGYEITAAVGGTIALTITAAVVVAAPEPRTAKPTPTPTVTRTILEERPVRIRTVPGPTKTVRVTETARPARQGARRTLPQAATGDPKSYARSLVSAGQWSCLNSLWQKESNWRHTATNPSSGAYGIPQSLPGSKMASAGSDWRTNPRTQIRWGLSYIKSRYGSPCGAWSHSQQKGWY